MDEPAAGDSVAALAPDDILDLTALGERYGASPALRWHGLTVSYRAYVRRAARIAAALAEAGVRPNQRIALPAELDPPTWATTLFAILATGAVAVLLPARAAARERDRLLAQTCAIERQGAPAQGAPAPAPVRISIHRPATVVFTSGSSGAAKAVLHSTANHLYNAAGSSANIPLALTTPGWWRCRSVTWRGSASCFAHSAREPARCSLRVAPFTTPTTRPPACCRPLPTCRWWRLNSGACCRSPAGRR